MMVRTVRSLHAMAWVLLLSAFGVVGSASAQEVTGQPHDWGLSFQRSVTEIMDQILWFEQYTLIIITVISVFVLALIVYVVVRFRASANPTPSRTTHNTMIEVVWTVIPVLILVAIAFPSFRMLYNQTTIPEPGLTVKATGGQWYWNYDYMDEELSDIRTILSYMLDDDDRAERMSQYGLPESEVPRLLAVDYPLVVPENTVVHVLTTALDVNHAVAVPAFGIKADSVVGRLNETWFNAREPGIYYGQCSQLCGRLHAYMPLEVRVLTQERFDAWVALAKDDIDAATDQLLRWQAEDSGAEVPVAAVVN